MFREIRVTTAQNPGLLVPLLVAGLSGCFHDEGGGSVGSEGFDAQIQAIEVTQGVRANIPSRVPPDALRVLVEDTAFLGGDAHVAGRRTVVRVYPWVRVYSGQIAPTLSARLHGFDSDGFELPGSPLPPQNTTLTHHSRYQNLPYMRNVASRSWNFVLPTNWTLRGTIRLEAVVNPPGEYFVTECDGCGDNNNVTLVSARFTTAANEASFIPYILNWANVASDGTVTRTQPTGAEVNDMLRFLYKTWPIPQMNYRGFFYVDTCIPDGVKCIDPYTGTDNTVTISPQDQQRAKITELGLVGGGYTMVPAIIDTDSINHVGDRMGCRGQAGVSGPPDYWQTACGLSFTHESAHAGPGRNHAGSFHGSVGAVDSGYPDPSGHGAVETNAYGFDVFDLQVIPPVDRLDRHTHDFMSYGSNTDFEWTSLYTWNAIRTWLDSSTASRAVLKATQKTTTSDPRQRAQTTAKPPQLLLLNPRDGGTANPTQNIALMGQAFDNRDGPLSGEQLVWQVDGETVGQGTEVTISGLSVGQHRISLQAKNSSGLQNTTSVTISVAPDADFDGLPDAWEISYGFDPDVPNATEDPDGDGLVNWRELAAGTNPNADDSDSDGSADVAEINAGTDPLDPDSTPGN